MQMEIYDAQIVSLTQFRGSLGMWIRPDSLECEQPLLTKQIRRFHEIVLHQGRIERFFLDALKAHSPIEVERGCVPVSAALDEAQIEDPNAYPITVSLRHLPRHEVPPPQGNSHSIGEKAPTNGLFKSNLPADDMDDLTGKDQQDGDFTETIHVKYMIGCDGAHSWTRGQLSFSMEGEQTDFIWGVLDIIPITDFPE